MAKEARITNRELRHSESPRGGNEIEVPVVPKKGGVSHGIEERLRKPARPYGEFSQAILLATRMKRRHHLDLYRDQDDTFIGGQQVRGVRIAVFADVACDLRV